MGTRFIDLIGKTFNRLTVLYKYPDSSKGVKWVCKCICGKESIVFGTMLRNNHTKSCGCLHKETISKIRKNNLTGKRFGRLTVIKEEKSKDKSYYSWLCKCDCGNEKIIRGQNLVQNQTFSCGCYLKEIAKSKKGTKNPNYNPLLTDEDRNKDRRFPGYMEWSFQTKQDKFFTCEICLKKSGKLNSHHLFNYADYPTVRIELWNCAVLCEICHKKFHKQYGKRFNTLNQFTEFYNKETNLNYTNNEIPLEFL